MGSWCQVEAAIIQTVLQRGMRPLRTWYHDRAVASVQQRKVIGRIAQCQNRNLRGALPLLQHSERSAFTDVGSEQMAEAIALHNHKLAGLRQLLQTPPGLGIRGGNKWNTAGPTLGLLQGFPAQTQQAIGILITEIVQSLQGLPQIPRQQCELWAQLLP